MRERLLIERIRQSDLAVLRADEDQHHRAAIQQLHAHLPTTRAQARRGSGFDLIEGLIVHGGDDTVHVRAMTIELPSHLESIVEQTILDGIPGEGTVVERLHAVTGQGQAFHTLISAVALNVHTTGTSSREPARPREEMLSATLRSLHHDDGFSDCVEDGEPYPCKTIRAVDIILGNAEPVVATDDLDGSGS